MHVAEKSANRIPSLDLIRGLVMVLMVIDHVRVYSGQPAGGPSAGIFFTRWVTHFCAPAFVFLAGTSAFLYGQKLADKQALSRFLLTRGLVLVVLELTVIRFFWTFQFDPSSALAGVIWMLGWCMVLLAVLVRLPVKVVGLLGIVIVALQQGFAMVPHALPQQLRAAVGWVWEFFYPADLERLHHVAILYVLIPWIGVMAMGFAFGGIMVRPPAERSRLCIRIGLGATALFLLAGCISTAMLPAPQDAPPFLFRLLNQRKYPASQLFLLMTLGPTILLLGLVEGAKGQVAGVLSVFGRVPMFFYLLHILIIHLAALLVTFVREGAVHPERYAHAPFAEVPAEFMWSLPLLYLVFFVVVGILYFPCRWFAGVKARGANRWLSYV